jgi:predicted RNA-binding protein YlqC (UPF0109 family)
MNITADFKIFQTYCKTHSFQVLKGIIETPYRLIPDGETTSIIELSVAKEDIGKIIGKQGKTATAIRTIMNAVSMKMKKRSILEIID